MSRKIIRKSPLLEKFHQFLVSETESIIYPWKIRGGKSTPFVSFFLAFVFCLYNGFLQIRYLSHYAEYPADWVKHPCFITGGMFEYVSGANFLGEITEWVGFALAGHSVHSSAFAIFTSVIGPDQSDHERSDDRYLEPISACLLFNAYGSDVTS
ncbi:unnamed protein product [Menidia menidia]|uniref:(Atlantic silverside) hypothetical protein n=1 Tax=Menidia menidia TaxID=238744 RepID=A0A8S4ASL0_9TELE|nr:unnamed protein product [Menidia menidia]